MPIQRSARPDARGNRDLPPCGLGCAHCPGLCRHLLDLLHIPDLVLKSKGPTP